MLIPSGVHVLVDKPIVCFDQVSNAFGQARRVLTVTSNSAAWRRPAVGSWWRWPSNVVTTWDFSKSSSWSLRQPRSSVSRSHAIQSSHADGQFRSPAEHEQLVYHGTSRGYGKLFHSGMHLVDVQSRLIRAAACASKTSYDAFVTFTQLLRPSGLVKQMSEDVLERIFGAEGIQHAGFVGHGELDLSAVTSFDLEREATCLVQLDLAHNSISGRAWATASRDLYKGNGRQKHERHVIRQGPFQTILVETYQTKHRHDVNTAEDFAYGGNNHFDITVFRNDGAWPHPTRPMEKITASDLAAEHGLSPNRLLNSHAKDKTLLDFVDVLTGNMPRSRHPSRLEDHWLNSAWMAALAESGATRLPVATDLSEMKGFRRCD